MKTSDCEFDVCPIAAILARIPARPPGIASASSFTVMRSGSGSDFEWCNCANGLLASLRTPLPGPGGGPPGILPMMAMRCWKPATISEFESVLLLLNWLGRLKQETIIEIDRRRVCDVQVWQTSTLVTFGELRCLVTDFSDRCSEV